MQPQELLRPCHLFKTRLQKVKQDKHERVWSYIFRDQAWSTQAILAGVNPVLVGPRLDLYYSYRSPSKGIYVYLDTGDKNGRFKFDHQNLFFSCLMPYSYDDSTKEVHFEDCAITLNVSDMFTDDDLPLIQNKALSRRCCRLQSKYMYLSDPCRALRRIRSCDIYDVPKGLFVSLSDVETCRLQL